MTVESFVRVSIFFCMLVACSGGTSMQFALITRDKQFKTFGTVKQVKAATVGKCSVECLAMGNRCGSFSFSRTNLCTVNLVRLNVQDVQHFGELLYNDIGTLVYGSRFGESYDEHSELSRWHRAVT